MKEKGDIKENGEIKEYGANSVTVPGAAGLWVDSVSLFGSHSLSLSDILQGAIDLAEKGYPVSNITSFQWAKGKAQIENARKVGGNGEISPATSSFLTSDGNTPKEGELMRNELLAKTFKELGEKGKEGFYRGRIAESIVNAISMRGGLMSLDDLSSHTTEEVKPISIKYKGIEVYEIPPNSQGITPLLALNILKGYEIGGKMEHNSAEYLHLLIESLRLAFADARWWVSDPSFNKIPLHQLLSDQYADQRRGLIDEGKAMEKAERGIPFVSSDTVYFTVVDDEGNAASFINSNYMGFGTGIEPEGCGFTLQNRGANFSMLPSHPNCVEGGKKPYHTIIPAIALNQDGNCLHRLE